VLEIALLQNNCVIDIHSCHREICCPGSPPGVYCLRLAVPRLALLDAVEVPEGEGGQVDLSPESLDLRGCSVYDFLVRQQ
jgi:hypothetical protein